MNLVIRTQDLPLAERFPFWLEVVCNTVMPVEVRSEYEADFRAEIRAARLGAMEILWLSTPPAVGTRTATLIRRSDPDVYHLALNLRGTVDVTQCRRTATLGPGDLTLYESSHPFQSVRMDLGSHTGSAAIVLVVPRTMLLLPDNKVGELVATRLPGDTGVHRLVSRYLVESSRNVDQYQPADAARLCGITLDLLTAMLAHELDATDSLPPETGQRALLARAHDFIHQHLGDPALAPQAVADALHISLRSLHRLFQGQDTTVAAWIRERRLDRARRDLTNPSLRARPIHAVAARCGFTDAAHFSRTFRAAFGTSPLSYRRRHDAPHRR